MNVGESKVLALEAVGELFVVEAKEMEESRVEVVDVDFSIDYAEATARNFLLEERSRKPGFGGIHGEKGVHAFRPQPEAVSLETVARTRELNFQHVGSHADQGKKDEQSLHRRGEGESILRCLHPPPPPPPPPPELPPELPLLQPLWPE